MTRKNYATAAVAEGLAEQFQLRGDFQKDVATHAYVNAPPAAGRFPVIVFSHGLSWPASLYQSLAEDLASRGYIFAAVNHPYDASRVELPDGRVLRIRPLPEHESATERDRFLAAKIDRWVRDIGEAVSVVKGWAEVRPEVPISGHVDAARVGLAGHSYGGSAVALLAAGETASAVAVLEGKLRRLSNDPLEVRVPLMHVIGEYNRLELEGRQYRPGPNAPVYQIIVRGAGHAYFSDLIHVYKTTSAPPDWLDRHRYETEPKRILQITSDYLGAFFDRFLRDKPSDLLHPRTYTDRVDGPRRGGYPEVELVIDVK
jgi:dienelactone hydrolase